MYLLKKQKRNVQGKYMAQFLDLGWLCCEQEGFGNVGLNIPPGQISPQKSRDWKYKPNSKQTRFATFSLQENAGACISLLPAHHRMVSLHAGLGPLTILPLSPSVTHAPCRVCQLLLFDLLGLPHVLPQIWQMYMPITTQLILQV